MCYHTAHPGKGELKKQFASKRVDYDLQEIFHVSGFGRPYLPVTLGAEPDAIVEARWKLIPFWVKDEEGAKRYANTLNAEGESVFEKPSYKPYVARQRGLLYVTGFYEPHRVEGAEFNNYPTFTVLTTKASPQLEVRSLIRPWDGEFEAHRVARVTAARGGEDTNQPEIQVGTL